MKIKILVIAVFLLSVVCCGASYAQDADLTPHDAFLKANAYYEQGDIDKAIELYSSIAEESLKSGNLFFNLGNCFLEQGDVGRAVLNYKRAALAIPRDSDLVFNLGYARSMMKQQDMPYMTSAVFSELIKIFSCFTLKENVFLFLAVYSLAVVFIIVGLFAAKLRPYMIFFTALACIGILIQTVPIYHKDRIAVSEAIVLTDIIDARYEPRQDANTHFPLYEGMQVFFLRSSGEWTKVKRPDGKIGWVPGESVEKILQ